MENYLINENTMVILPINNNSKVIEKHFTYIIEHTPYEIIDYSCKTYGSSFIGRCDATYFITGVKYKCPIIISEIKQIIMFPTKAPKKEDCVWINYRSIQKYSGTDVNSVEILLLNDSKLNLNISSRIINNQIFKSSRLDSLLKSKK